MEFHGIACVQSIPMQFQTPIRTASTHEDVAMPPKLVNKIEEHWREIERVEVFRKENHRLEKTNEITLHRAQAGAHPEADAMAIAQNTMQIVAANVAAAGLASYVVYL